MNDERIQFLEWKNEKAILQQKIQIQDMYIQEAKEREENLRKMNEIFINTLNQQQNENVVQKFQKNYEQNEIEKQQDIINAQQIEIKLLESKLVEKENQIKLIQKSNEKEIEKLQKRIVELEYQLSNKENINYQNIIEYQVNQQYDDDKTLQQRKRNQSPSYPTTRIRAVQQQQQQQQQPISNNKFDESTIVNQDQSDITSFFTRINPNLQRQMKDIQSKLYNTKKKLTTTTEQESSFIRQSIQKIKNRSRNHSISINENTYCEQRSTWDDQVEYRTNQTNQTNQSLICNGFRFS
ncbi:unnamed protein product [Paramecium sonneborni]|uniref:Uncharacterized protein n=1 Tax=Paramecium sonneborni TaxID=65129 RepID=A0A8S1M6C6_9CILI|nr:unnamed protein product [Paramecium sonneborni]